MRLNSDQGRVEGHIRITAPAILGPPYLCSIFSDFLKKFPNVSISTTFVNREVNLIEEGFDLALRVGDLTDSNLISRPISEFPMALVASPKYLGENAPPKHPKDLANHNCLINTLLQAPRRWRFRDQQRSFTVKVDGQYQANDDMMLLSLSCTGNGIAYLPGLLLEQHLKQGELVLLLTEYIHKPSPISIVYPSRHHLTNAKRQLIECLVNQNKRQ